jgi:hypothetical protein
MEALQTLVKDFSVTFQEKIQQLMMPPASSSLPQSGHVQRSPGNALPVAAQMWIYIFLGRMLHELGKYDSWQIICFFKGVGGSGKSSIAHIVKNFFAPSDVGVLSNNAEAKFGLSALMTKLIYICFEIKKSTSIDQSEFQSMVSGEAVSVAIKNQTARTVQWKLPGMLCGNEIPSWVDSQGSIARRLMIVNFRYTISNKDSRPDLLQEILKTEMAALIVKCNTAYRYAAARHAKEDIWKVLPKYFADERLHMQRESDPLINALYDTTAFELWDHHQDLNYDEFYLLFDQFESEYKNRHRALRGNSFADPLIDDKVTVPFKEAGISKCHCTRKVNEVDKTDWFLLGIRSKRKINENPIL